MEQSEYQDGQRDAAIKRLQEDVAKLVTNQETIMAFLAKQEGGQKYVWAIFGAIGAMVAFIIEIINFVTGIFKVKF